tara:strand:+ start:1101 stop:1361 length:261 start_codon:yes stop_codon:yes gene_type:complete
MNKKMMQQIEMMLTKHKAMKHGGKDSQYVKPEEDDYDEEDDYAEEDDYDEEDESEGEDEVTIKFYGKDAIKKAHELLMGSAYRPKK